MITVVTRSARTLDIQFYVNNSVDPHYGCASLCPNRTLTCTCPFDQPFFVRIGGAASASLFLEIEYSVMYGATTRNGCFVSQIPTSLLADEDSAILQPQNYCTTMQQHRMRLLVRVVAVAAIVVAVAVLLQWLGYWDFGRWAAVPGDVPASDRGLGGYSVESTFEAARQPAFMLCSSSESSTLSDTISE
jgi:hypothetical protein